MQTIGNAQGPDVNSHDQNLLQSEVVIDERYYKLIKYPDFKYYYYVYNDYGEVVDQGELDKWPSLTLLDGDVVNLHVGVGTGIALEKYYSIERDALSRNYSYVAAYSNEIIAYIYVPEENSFEERRLVVRNVFDKSIFYREFKLDFSRVTNPITNAKFIERVC